MTSTCNQKTGRHKTLHYACIAAFAFLAAGCAPTSPPPEPSAEGSRNATEGVPYSAKAERPATEEQPAAETVAADLPAGEILQRLLAKYRAARSYQDDGIVRLAFEQVGRPVSAEWPVAVAFERPNKLSLAAYQATVKCDGRQWKARIEDPETGNVDGQVVVRAAPKAIKLTDLAADPLLYDIIASQLRRQPIQLELLLESGGLVSAFGADIACRKLESADHDGRPCFRVEVPSPGGPFVFWVDRGNFLLRRLDYPAAALLPDVARDPSVSKLQLTADLRGAKIDAPIAANAYVLDVPATAKEMKTFVIPPQPLPTDLFGQQPASFFFTDLEGGRVEQQDLSGKIAVLVWYHDHPACEATLQQVSLAGERLKDEPLAAVYAVATDPTITPADAVRQRLADWQVELPVVRDLEAFGDNVFHIAVQPTIVVLGKEGKVQIFQAGGNPQLADQLVEIASRLKGGDDLAAEVLGQQRREREQYEQLVSRGGPEPGEVIELPEAVIRKRSDPKHLRLEKLWTCAELQSPGNVLAIEEEGQPTRLFVFEGGRTVTEVDAEGQIVRRHALEIPEQAVVTYARTTVDPDGQRVFAASSPLAPLVFVFDRDWQLIATVPAAGDVPLQIVDLALANVGEGEGEVEVVAASVGDQGLVALGQDGAVRWRNRAFPNVVSAATTPEDEFGQWAFLLTGESGEILRVNRFGHEEPAVKVANWPILRLRAGQFESPKQAVYLGLSNNAKGDVFAVGLSSELKECWNYPLPSGAHQRPIEPIASSDVLPGQSGQWWLAGPDGSVHLISEDGEFFDSFHVGAVLTGLTATRINNQPVLLLATDEGLSAWRIELPKKEVPRKPPRREF